MPNDGRPTVARPDYRPDYNRPHDGRPNEARPDYNRPDDGRPAVARPDYRPDYNRPDDGRPTDGRPDYIRPDGGRPTDGRPTDGRPTDGRPTDGRPDYIIPDGGRPTDGRPTDGRPDYIRPDDGRPTEERPDDYQPSDNVPGEPERVRISEFNPTRNIFSRREFRELTSTPCNQLKIDSSVCLLNNKCLVIAGDHHFWMNSRLQLIRRRKERNDVLFRGLSPDRIDAIYRDNDLIHVIQGRNVTTYDSFYAEPVDRATLDQLFPGLPRHVKRVNSVFKKLSTGVVYIYSGRHLCINSC